MLEVRNGPASLQQRPARVRSRSCPAGVGPACPVCLHESGRTARSEHGQQFQRTSECHRRRDTEPASTGPASASDNAGGPVGVTYARPMIAPSSNRQGARVDTTCAGRRTTGERPVGAPGCRSSLTSIQPTQAFPLLGNPCDPGSRHVRTHDGAKCTCHGSASSEAAPPARGAERVRAGAAGHHGGRPAHARRSRRRLHASQPGPCQDASHDRDHLHRAHQAR
mgnify:FL=1